MSTDARGRTALEQPVRQHIIDFAVEVSRMSPCRSKRGVVLFSGGDILGHGYNYKPRGFDCDGSDACKATCRVEAVHAEQAALLSFGRKANGAEMLHVKTVDGALVPSGGPSCPECSKLALTAGVTGFWLFHEHGWQRYEMAEFHRLSLLARVVLASPQGQGAATFESFSAINRERCESPLGFRHALDSWSTSDWFLAVLGELGEAANIAKKLNRVRDGIPGNKESPDALRDKLRRELGDAFVYLDLLAQSLGISIGAAAFEVFNAKSDELGCPIRLPVSVIPPERQKEEKGC